jgi:hypothetical protein
MYDKMTKEKKRKEERSTVLYNAPLAVKLKTEWLVQLIMTSLTGSILGWAAENEPKRVSWRAGKADWRNRTHTATPALRPETREVQW